jgi:tetraacyldisaccharide 4'-kinase
MKPRPLLQPLVPLYAAGLWTKQRLMEQRPGYARWLAEPVISVGSLSAGGAGKTPVVEALARLLLTAGYEVDVLSRGYGRTSGAVERVDPEGDPRRFGDEPILLARGLGVPVFVGADRHGAGVLAERAYGQPAEGRENGSARGASAPVRVHLLDDGFQHRRLGRALDVVLLTAQDLEDRLLPAGNLREPLPALRRADAVVLRAEEYAQVMPAVERYGRTTVPVWPVKRQLHVDTGARKVLAFCAIARPEGFFAMLRKTGVEVLQTASFRDHHQYTAADAKRLARQAQRVAAAGFVTTAKDVVKLDPALRARLETVGPVAIAELQARFEREDEVMASLAERLRRGSRRS